MFSRFNLLSVFLFTAVLGINAEEPSVGIETHGGEMHRRFRDRTLVLEINASVIEPGIRENSVSEQNRVVVWNETHQRITLPGNPVGIRLVGSNLIVAVQFTPFLRHRGGRGQSVLVVQGQVWTEIPNEGIRYHTLIQTIPIDFNEPVYFFPLGDSLHFDSPHIEIILTMKTHNEAVFPEEAAVKNEN